MFYYNLAESGERLKKLRKEKGREYTQEKVAEEIGISREHLNRLETGKKGCSVDLLIILSQYYGKTLDYITYGKEAGQDVINLSEKMDMLPPERRLLAETLVYSILKNLLYF